MQFEHAEFDQTPPTLKCSRCERDLIQHYYQINGQIACEACALTAQSAAADEGSGLGRAMRATGAGVAAAVLGATLYYAVGALTGYEFGLIAIVVGFAVGSAVRWGSRGRGGWRYQTLAIALTYLAIVGTYVPYVFAAAEAESAAEETAGAPADATVADDDDDDDKGAEAAEATAVANTSAPPAAGANVSIQQQVTAGQAAMALGILVLILAAAPFLAGFQNIVGLIIIGLGLYEAWRLNKRELLVTSGPHPVNVPAASASA